MVRDILAALVLVALASCSTSGGVVVVESCADGGACFSNDDCPAGQRCAVPANADLAISVTCCLPGPRGLIEAGAPCGDGGMNDCASAVCAYTASVPLCSGACRTDHDCKGALPTCITVSVDAGFCGLPP